MDKDSFILALRAEILARYPWATNGDKVEAFIKGVEETLNTSRNVVNIDGEAFAAAWKAIGGKGRLTYKALRALA